MTWIKLDDNAVDHPKIASLTDRAFRWWVRGLSYASRLLTNGVLPPTFWKQTPNNVRKELTTGQLWDWHDPNFHIHDYLKHQSSREDVNDQKARNREKSQRYRENQKAAASPVTSDHAVTGNASPVRDRGITDPESREQSQRTEIRDQKKTAAAPLIKSPAYVEKRRRVCAFVGSRIEVPNDLHAELRTGLGGVDPEKALQDWYLELNEAAEVEGWRVPVDDGIFKWLKALYTAKFPVTLNGHPKRDDSALMARLQAIERGEIKR